MKTCLSKTGTSQMYRAQIDNHSKELSVYCLGISFIIQHGMLNIYILSGSMQYKYDGLNIRCLRM